MICKILTENKTEYFSVVLGLVNLGWKEEVIVLNEDKTKIITKHVYSLSRSEVKRKVFILDYSMEDWKKKQVSIKGKIFKNKVEITGFSWVIEKFPLMNFNEEEIENAKTLDKNTRVSEWNVITNEIDAENLSVAAWNFHDSVLDSCTYRDNSARVVFKGCWQSSIELIFQEVETVHLSSDILGNCIFSSSILFHDNSVYWVDNDVKTVEEINDTMTFFKSKAILWKLTPESD